MTTATKHTTLTVEQQMVEAHAAIVEAQTTALAALTRTQQLREAVRAGIFSQRDQVIVDAERAHTETMRALTSARVRLASLEDAQVDAEEMARREALVADRHHREQWVEHEHPELLAAIAEAEAEERALLNNKYARDSGIGQMELTQIRRRLAQARNAFTAALDQAPATEHAA